MADTTTPSAREEMHRYAASTFEEIDAYLDEEDDEKRDELAEAMEPLCVMKQVEYNVQLSWGGPSHGFKVSYDPEAREFVRGVFYFMPWFGDEEMSLSDDELDRVVRAYGLDGLAD